MVKYNLTHLLPTLILALWMANAVAAEPREISGKIGRGGLLLVAAKLNSHPFQGVIDTGASHHAYDRTLIPFLDEFESSNSGESLEICVPQRLEAGSLRDTVKAGSAVVDLSQFSRAANVQIDAVIGMPFLLGRVINVHPSDETFTISEEGLADDEGIKIRLDEVGRPCVPITIAGNQLIALIDTGSNADVTANPNDFRSIEEHYADTNGVSVVSIQSLQDKAQGRKIEACDVKLGGELIRNVSIVESSSTKVGMAFLTRFAAVIDLQNMRLSLNSPPGQP